MILALTALALLAADGIVMRFTNVLTVAETAEKAARQSEGGTHADEIETSMMLYIAPDSVDMSKTVKDYHPGPGPLSRHPEPGKTYSASGVYGDATLATRAKGEKVVNAMIEGIVKDIEQLRRTALR